MDASQTVTDPSGTSSEVWRAVFGLVGATLVYRAVRGILRVVGGERHRLIPELHRRGQIWGRVLLVLGVVFFVMSVVEPVAEETVAISGWAEAVYLVGAVYLVMMGLVLQWDPTRHLRRQRIARGEGRPGVGRVVNASDTGRIVNGAPQVEIDFEIEVGGRTHLVSDKIVMEQAKLELLIPGSTVDVLVDRVDPNVFHVEWESWRAPHA